MQKIAICFWFNDRVEEAVPLYVSLFKDAKIVNTVRHTEAAAKEFGLEAGAVSSMEFELTGQKFTAINGGPMYKLTEAASIQAYCKDQKEIDKLWDALSKDGKEMSCGWLVDKFGLTWQIVPENLDAMMTDPDAAKASAVSAALFSMEGKLNMSKLENAYKDAK